ncbi:alpha/beta hydrolase [uncultured Flavobacterium sp.]|uniref:alpha/beta hydrolase n=1 Tax=uncultured Flavobacterium sp. TaxID=165435 RepID=UPI0030EEF008|tara:strand:+ start:220547 stop:221401 length:855 start_codon:yes stop_codon:yes gene_type:complete
MKTNNLFFGLLLFLLIPIYSCSNDNASTTEDLSVAKTMINVSYGSNLQQVFDLYLPANRSSTSTKTLILVHGGGWIEGDKVDMNYAVDIIKQFLPEYAIANVNYRLATTGNYAFPMQIDDINAIVQKLKVENYGISDDFGFIGTSAGGHLSLLYSYGYNSNNNIKMVCSIVGPTNFTDSNYVNNPAWLDLYFNLTGVHYADNPSYYEQLSPLYRATSSSVPTIMFYGNADPLIPTSQGVDLHTKLDQLGVYNEFNLYNGGHGNWSQTDLLDANLKMIAFIQNKF